MADAELTVRISGDTGDLESSISRVESQLSQLEKSGGRGAESIAKASLNQGGFAKTVEQSKKALDEKKRLLHKRKRNTRRTVRLYKIIFRGLKSKEADWVILLLASKKKLMRLGHQAKAWKRTVPHIEKIKKQFNGLKQNLKQ